MNKINEKQLRPKLEKSGQNHMIEALERLQGCERKNLAAQLLRIDRELLSELQAVLRNPPRQKPLEKIEPAPVKRLPKTEEKPNEAMAVAEKGKVALENDRVAALTVAGGQGTRLGFDGPKGAFPIIPKKNKSLFHLLAEKISSARNRYRCRMPWLIMTSPNNDCATKKFFEKNDFFGMDPNSVHFFTQNLNPILGPGGKLVLEEADRLLMGPDGHGGVFAALQSSGLIEKLESETLDLISYFQVDNPLVTVADERYIGYHLMENADFSCKVIPKRDPFEGLGVAVLKKGRPAIIEYVDLPEKMACEKNENNKLKYRFGSIAIHIINSRFAGEMAEATDAMPWHVAEKNYKILGPGGEKEETRCYKFEKFVFDCLEHARGCAFVEVDRESEFAPVKNASGKDSPEECREKLRAQG